MDEIENFLLHQNFNVSILLRVYDRLRQFSFISEVDLYTLILSCAGDKPNFSRHLKAYASLVIVSSMVPSLSLNRKVQFQLKRECETQSLFIDSIVNILKQKQNQNLFAIIQDIKTQYLQYQASAYSHEYISSVREISNPVIISDVGNIPEVVLLLSKLRKLGMDMLFPQHFYDICLGSILTCFVVLKRPAAHREILDILIFAKESGYFHGLGGLTKTKIRGILALLKHSDVLLPHMHLDEPTKLFLSPNVASIEALRYHHDRYLSNFLVDHHVNISTNLMKEIVWVNSSTTNVKDRAALIIRFTSRLEHFIMQNLPFIDELSSVRDLSVVTSKSHTIMNQPGIVNSKQVEVPYYNPIKYSARTDVADISDCSSSELPEVAVAKQSSFRRADSFDSGVTMPEAAMAPIMVSPSNHNELRHSHGVNVVHPWMTVPPSSKSEQLDDVTDNLTIQNRQNVSSFERNFDTRQDILNTPFDNNVGAYASNYVQVSPFSAPNSPDYRNVTSSDNNWSPEVPMNISTSSKQLLLNESNLSLNVSFDRLYMAGLAKIGVASPVSQYMARDSPERIDYDFLMNTWSETDATTNSLELNRVDLSFLDLGHDFRDKKVE